jgi:internalin A
MAVDRETEDQIPETQESRPGWDEALKRIKNAQRSKWDVLTLSNLDLKSVPPQLTGVRDLRVLDLAANRLSQFPAALRQLPKLERLRLSFNALRDLPDWIGELAELEGLWLTDNRISDIPESITQLANLKYVRLEGNPLPDELLAAALEGVPSLMRYLRYTAQTAVNPRTVKLVLLGEPQSGKTTLLEALKGNPKPCDPNRKETLGVDVVRIEATNALDKKPMYLSTWDFAGQHIEHATHQFFLTEGAIYLILWNARQGTESGKRDLWYWLELLKMRVKDPKFLLIATHTEHTPPDLNLTEIEKTYPGLEGHLSVDLENLKGFDALRTKLLEVAAQLPSLQARWPAEWLPIRDEIRKRRKTQPHMTPAEFSALLKSKRVTGQEAIDLANQLHHLGEILFFQEREELSSLVILDPEWLTELIALVVRSREVRAHGGILRKADLDQLWAKAKLTPEIRRHLVNLMDWFDLTYSTGHPQEIGIVVEALPYSTPEDLKQLPVPSGPQMEMIFRFPTLQRRLPPGIPTWGIARAHRFSKHTPWRDAAFFEDADTKSSAYILASDSKKEVRLRVISDFPPFFFGRMEAILRDTFKRYPGAVPERRIPCTCSPDCPHSYPYEMVRKRWQHGKEYVICESGSEIAIKPLLTGFERPQSEEGLLAFRAEMRRTFTVLLSALRGKGDEGCPSVFTLVPLEPFQQLDTWLESKTKSPGMELALYCEHDSGWHQTAHSLYRFRPDQHWFEELKRSWNRFVGVTKHVGPLAIAAGKAAQVPWIEAGGLGIDKLPEAPVSDTGKFAAVLGGQAEAGFVDLETRHVLEGLVRYLDAQRAVLEAKNGGLHKYLMDDGRWLWLCPDHIRSYQTRSNAPTPA